MTVALAVVLLILLTGPAEAQDFRGFAGTWERDAERSDDAKEKLEAAMEEMRERMSRRGRRSGGFPARDRGGRRGESRRGGPQGMANIPEELILEVDGTEFHVDGGERLRIYYLDGEKHKREMPNGIQMETTATRRGNAILIEEKMERGEIEHEYELAPEGDVMIWTMTMDMDGMKDPVVIKTVYDRIES